MLRLGVARSSRVLTALIGVSTLVFGAFGSAGAVSSGTGQGLKLVAEVPFEDGSHMEFASIKGRDYAFVSELKGLNSVLRVIDVTVPSKPKVVAKSPCTGFQGNVQVSHDKKTLVVGIDDNLAGAPGGAKTSCPHTGDTGIGFITLDISNPKRPRSIGFADTPKGSHSLATHPTKPYVYSGDGFPESPGSMQVWSIKNPARPKLVTTLDTGAHSPHDLAFNARGTMAATANVINLHLLDTRDPAKPKIVHTTQCPGCLHTHEARFTPDGKRLVVNDEYPVPTACPGGAMYFYDLSQEGSTYGLTLSGAYTIGEKGRNIQGEAPLLCTPHIFDISTDGKRLAISWHQGGLKYLDISKTAGVTAGSEQLVPGGVKELGWYANVAGDVFSAKIFKGPYVYAVDITAGFQVFKVTN